MECTNDFMEKGAPRIDPAFESAANKYTERKRQLDTFQRVNPRKESFKKFLGFFTKHAKDKEIKNFDINRRFRWEDVQAEANAALEAYSTQVRFRSQPIRYLSRSFTENASTLESFLHFIPDGEYTFIICGALTLVFNAAKRMANLRQRILGCLDSLPKVVNKATAYRELYSEDPDLLQAAENLYLGILNGVEAMLLWMDESAFKKTIKSLFLQDSYGKTIEDQAIKAGIEESANEFHQIAELCLHKSVGKMIPMLEDMTNCIKSLEKDCVWRNSTPHAQILIQNTPFIDVYELQQIMAVDRNLLTLDMTVAVANAQRISSSSFNAHAMTLLQHGRFMRWYQSSSSSILLVNGHMHLSSEQETSSPLTIVSWVLYQMLTENATTLPLLHLCGQHVHLDDKYRGLAGILRCLNAQLLFGNPECVNTTGFDYRFTHDLDLSELSALCHLLHILVTSSPRQAVFILIDGFTLVEGSTPTQQLQSFVESLLRLTHTLNTNKQTGPVLKILLTNPTASVYLGQWLRDCVLDLAETTPEGEYGRNQYEDYSAYW